MPSLYTDDLNETHATTALTNDLNHIPSEVPQNQQPDFSQNMAKYWDNFDSQLKYAENTMKETDRKVLKMFMMERLLPEYSTIALSQVIHKICSLVYYHKLQKSANKTFLQWVGK